MRDTPTTKRNNATLLMACALGAFAGGACGDLADPDQPAQVLLTLKGEVTNAAKVSASAPVRMALVWSNAPTEQDNTFSVSQDIPMQTQFPASFSLKITGLPPKAMVMTKADLPADERDDLPDGFGFAIGGLVVYADDNGNGQLDLVGPGDQPTDRILGADDELHMLYFEGTLPPPLVPPSQLDGSFQLGYNLVRFPECTFSGASCGNDKAKVYATTNGAIDGVELPLTQDPRLARWMCNGDFGDSVGAGTTQIKGPAQPPYPAADDPKLVCIDGGASFMLQSCTEITKGPCSGTEISCTGAQYSMPDPQSPPADWPCPLGATGGSSGSGAGGAPPLPSA